MNRIVAVLSLLVLGCPVMTLAGPKEDVAAATQTWIAGMTARDVERVVTLYDSEAVLWGTRSPTLHDTPGAVREYFNILRTVPSSYKAALGEQRIRIYGDIAINTGTYVFSEIRDGTEIIRPARFSFVYRNSGGRWLIIESITTRRRYLRFRSSREASRTGLTRMLRPRLTLEPPWRLEPQPEHSIWRQ